MAKINKVYSTTASTVTAGSSTFGTASSTSVYTNPTNIPQNIEGFSFEFDTAVTSAAYAKIQYVIWIADTTSDTIDWSTTANLTTYADKIFAYGSGVVGQNIRYYDRAEPKTRRSLSNGQTLKIWIAAYGNAATPTCFYSWILMFYTK